ncbi:hypothetical protein ACFL3Q_05135 [Planctomycetota bacterium]
MEKVERKRKKGKIDRICDKLREKEKFSLLKRVNEVATTFSNESLSAIASSVESCARDIQRSIRNCVLIVDRAGGGKTNLMCHLGALLARHGPTLLLFGKENYNQPDHLIGVVKDFAASLMEAETFELGAMEALDDLLKSSGMFLNVLIDGINESRDIPGTDVAIMSFLDWSRKHRVRICITCRDIYFDFFEHESWDEFVYELRQNELYQFALSEYAEAIPLYFKHFKIECSLLDAAHKACQHPLLLRFFCEAYGNPDGDFINLGTVRDIRLKELFDEYVDKKTGQIRHFLHHRDRRKVNRFILSMADYMFSERRTSILTPQIEEATGESDIDSERSIYVKLLDEDIIIEEEPTEQVDCRLVRFVYEEFMEYILAKSFLSRFRRLKRYAIGDYFKAEKDKAADWVNFRGVAEYIALMFLADDSELTVEDGIRLMEAFISLGSGWTNIFWSVVGKLPEHSLRAELFDTFHRALETTVSYSAVEKALEVMHRFTTEGADKLASAVLWSGLLPNVLRWSDLDERRGIIIADREELILRLRNSLQHEPRYQHIIAETDGRKSGGYRRLLDIVLPYLDRAKGERLKRAIKKRGRPGETDFVHAMHIVRDLYPLHRVYLLNGLFHADAAVVRFCADKLKLVKTCRQDIAIICRSLASVETCEEIRKLLLHSADWQEREIRISKI